MLNDKVLPFYQEQGVDLLRILTDRGTEYCGGREHHKYQLYLNIEDIVIQKQKVRKPMAFVKGSIAQCRMNFMQLL